MKKYIYLLTYAFSLIYGESFAESTSVLGIDDAKLKNGDVTISDIPKAIQNITTYILGFAATIGMIMIIVGGLKYVLGTMEGSAPNKSKATDTIKYGIMGFVLAVSSWFIVKLVIENF